MPDVQNTFEPHRERPRNRSMVRMEVENRNTRCLCLPDGQVVEPGISVIQVYEDNEKVVLAQVEDNPAAIQSAKERFELAIAEQVQKELDGQWMQLTAQEMADVLRTRKHDGREVERRVFDAYEKTLKRTGSSIESEFHAANRRGIKPLVSAKVIERDITEPQRALQAASEMRTANVLAQALAQAFGGQPPVVQQQQNQHNKK